MDVVLSLVLRLVLSLALAVLVVIAAGPAQAQLGVNAGVSAGVNNNNLKVKPEAGVVPEDAAFSNNQADGVARTALGAHYLARGPRSDHLLEYSLSAYFYIQREQSVSFAHELGWTALINPTRFSQLDLSLRGNQGRTSDLDLFSGQEPGASEARPVFGETFLSASLGENLRWELGPFWEFGQRLEGELYAPTGAATRTSQRTLGAQAGLNLSRIWLRDQAGLFVEAGHGRSNEVIFDEPMEGLLGYPARRANYGRAGLAWGHAFSDYWSADIDAGLLGVQVPHIREPFVDFGAGATVTHRTDRRGTLSLRVERGIDTNVYIGDVLLQNSIGLRAELPFGHKEAWNLEGDMEYQRSNSLFVVDTKDTLQVFSTAAILTYDWTRYSSLLFELNFTYQDSEAGLRNMLRTEPFTQHRTMFLVTIDMHYPQGEDDMRGGAHRLSGGRGSSSSLDDEEGEEEGGESTESTEGSSEEPPGEGTAPP